MPYIETADYDVQIRADVLSKVTDGSTTVLPTALRIAQEEIRSYLRTRYKIDEEYTKTANDRNPILVTYCVDIMLYHIHSRINPRNIPELRFVRYNAAIDWLKSVNSGKLSAGIPLLDDPDGEGRNNNADVTTMYTFQKRGNNY